METIYYIKFKSILGNLTAYSTDNGLLSLELPGRKFVKEWLSKYVGEYKLKEVLRQSTIYVKQFAEYFAKKRKNFNFPIDMRGTNYQKSVWKKLLEVPYGFVVPYQYIALSLGKPQSSRAVAQAIAENHLPIVIPCHRVIEKSGKIGGFSASITIKKKLLGVEGVSQRLIENYTELYKVGRCGKYCGFCKLYTQYNINKKNNENRGCLGCGYPLSSRYNRRCEIKSIIRDNGSYFCYELKDLNIQNLRDNILNLDKFNEKVNIRESLNILKRNRVSVWLKMMEKRIRKTGVDTISTIKTLQIISNNADNIP
ncbi:MAG: methylated-DNA--[protein]-cysteine S-methyltransferase [bacterium]